MLKNIKKNILALAKKINLTLTEKNINKIDGDISEKKRFYAEPVEKNLFFKAAIKKDIKIATDLKREAEIYKVLAKKFKKTRFFPELLAYGKYKNVVWLLKTLEKGEFAGDMDKDFGIKKGWLLRVSPSSFAKIIFSYQNIRLKAPLYRQGGWWYWQDFNYHKNNFLNKFINSSLNGNLISKRDINLAQKIIKKNKNLLDEEAEYLSHGDLYPNNLILNKEKRAIIIDWGMANLNNFAFDVSFVYFMAHRSPEWQKIFLKNYLNHIRGEKKRRFKELFRIVSISLTLRFANQCHRFLKNNPDKELSLIFKKQITAFKQAIYS